MNKLLLVVFLFFSSHIAFSDSVIYRNIMDISVESKKYIVNHHHDWNWPNNYAHIECMDKSTGNIVFSEQSPALTNIFISDDEQFIVGLSNIKVDNPFNVVVINVEGKYVLEKHIDNIGVRNYYQSVANFAFWFNETNPEIKYIYKNNNLIGISLLDNENKKIIIFTNKFENSIRLLFYSIGIMILIISCILYFCKIYFKILKSVMLYSIMAISLLCIVLFILGKISNFSYLGFYIWEYIFIINVSYSIIGILIFTKYVINNRLKYSRKYLFLIPSIMTSFIIIFLMIMTQVYFTFMIFYRLIISTIIVIIGSPLLLYYYQNKKIYILSNIICFLVPTNLIISWIEMPKYSEYIKYGFYYFLFLLGF
jgi:hypothetical protein